GRAPARPGRPQRPCGRLVPATPGAATRGRVCSPPGESVGTGPRLDSAVSIHAVERFLGDLALERGWAFDPPPARSRRRVLVVGAGPSGLSAAYHLARLGHAVEVRGSGERPGGMMRSGIPAYRLPRGGLGAGRDTVRALRAA